MASESMPRRFWEKVDKSGECWVWTAATFSTGYGAFRLGKRQMKAHRVAWLIEHGKDPLGFVCHRCDNPLCVRPDHLFVGTAADNMRDRNQKGRTSQRERSPHCKLGEDVRAKIRSEYKRGSKKSGVVALSKKYGVGASTISRIVAGRWR